MCVQTCSCDGNYAPEIVHVKGFCVQTCSLGERLREERDRLGLKQEELGQIGGVNRNTQGKYEKSERSPDGDYLAKVSAVGVDVLYVVTGQRSTPSEGALGDDESTLLNQYRSMPDSDRATVRRLTSALAESTGRYVVNNQD